jgi:hypothetical protein
MAVTDFDCDTTTSLVSSMVHYANGQSGALMQGQTAYLALYTVGASSITENTKRAISEGTNLCSFSTI